MSSYTTFSHTSLGLSPSQTKRSKHLRMYILYVCMYVLLFRLDLGGCLRLTDEAVIKLAESCNKTLTWMNLSGGSSIQSLSPLEHYCYCCHKLQLKRIVQLLSLHWYFQNWNPFFKEANCLYYIYATRLQPDNRRVCDIPREDLPPAEAALPASLRVCESAGRVLPGVPARGAQGHGRFVTCSH